MKTKKLAVCRIVLDIVMLLLTASMFSHRAISLMYHEIGGFVLVALFFVHCFLNAKTIKAMCAKRETTAPRLKFLQVLDVVNTVAWIALLVTSILVSRHVFPFGMRGLQGWHKFTAAAAILTTGVHFGMHWSFFRVKLDKACAACKVIVILLLAAVLSYGSHSLYSTNYIRWFSAPFGTHQMRGAGNRGGQSFEQQGERRMGNGENAPWANAQADGENAPQFNEKGEFNPEEQAQENLPENKPEGAPEGQLPAEREANGEENAEEGEGRRGRHGRGEGRRGRRNRGEGENAEEFRGEGFRGRGNREDGENGEGRRGRGERGNRENGENGRGEGQGRRGAGRGQQQPQSGAARLFKALGSGMGLMFFFAAVTHCVDHALRAKKKVQGAAEAEPKKEAIE